MTQVEKLAEAVEELRFLQKNGPVAIHSKDLSAAHLILKKQ
jgi:hypothetical protein